MFVPGASGLVWKVLLVQFDPEWPQFARFVCSLVERQPFFNGNSFDRDGNTMTCSGITTGVFRWDKAYTGVVICHPLIEIGLTNLNEVNGILKLWKIEPQVFQFSISIPFSNGLTKIGHAFKDEKINKRHFLDWMPIWKSNLKCTLF